MSLPNQTDLRALLQRALHPRTKLGKVTLWIGALALLLQVLRGILRRDQAACWAAGPASSPTSSSASLW